MRVIVDRTRCVGSGMCTSIAPDLFALDDDGVLVINHDGVVDASQADAVDDAVACCPVEALAVEAGGDAV